MEEPVPAANEPAEQPVQLEAVEPVAELKVPARQLTQLGLPPRGWRVPDAHGVQMLAACEEYRPSEHAAQEMELAIAEKFPAVQPLHTSAPLPEYAPAEQS